MPSRLSMGFVIPAIGLTYLRRRIFRRRFAQAITALAPEGARLITGDR